jgi:hypothetical protein
MSNSIKEIPKINEILSRHNIFDEKPTKREISIEKSKPSLSLNSSNDRYEISKKINKNLTILSLITCRNKRKESINTSCSDIEQEKKDYELYMIDKYDENLNNSLSFISEFDLEGEDNNLNDSFDSCHDDNSVIEEIDITSKTKKNIFDYKDDEEDNKQLEKEWNDIKDFLLNKNSSN